MNGPNRTWERRIPLVQWCALAVSLTLQCHISLAAEPIVLAGPAMGTTYRVTLAAAVPGLSRGEVHRELERALTRIDQGCSTWRDDSDVSRFNRSKAHAWIDVGTDLAEIVVIARDVHAETAGVFDITVSPLVTLWRDAIERHKEPSPDELIETRARIGMPLVEVRQNPDGTAALRKLRAGVQLDLGGIGPGYAVDCLGERLVELGSTHHLVTLGGEARAWGTQADGNPWTVHVHLKAAPHPPDVIELCAGDAVAFSTRRPGRSPVDVRTGRPCEAPAATVMFRSSRCSHADAWAVAIALGAAPHDHEK